MAILSTIRRGLLILPTVFLATQLSASADQLEDKLNQQYKDHIYMLRQPMTAPTQQYDPHGNSPTASAIGPWTVYGRMQIGEIRVESNRLIVEGGRIGMKFSDHARLLVPVKLNEKVRLEIALNQPLNSADQVHEILGHVFAFTKEDFLASVPEFWREYLTKYLDFYEEDGTRFVFKPYVPEKVQPRQASATPDFPKDGIFHVGNGVTAQKPIFSA